MKILEDLVYIMWKKASECTDELNILNKKLTIPKLPFKRISYDDAVNKLNTNDCKIEWVLILEQKKKKFLGI